MELKCSHQVCIANGCPIKIMKSEAAENIVKSEEIRGFNPPPPQKKYRNGRQRNLKLDGVKPGHEGIARVELIQNTREIDQWKAMDDKAICQDT